MTVFLVVFFLLYGLMHLYAFVNAKVALHFSLSTGIAVCLFCAVMIISPVIVRLAERAGLEGVARPTAFVGYLWMAALFLFCSFAVVIDLWRFLVFLASTVTGTSLTRYVPPPRLRIFIPAVAAAIVVVYGYVEALTIRTERVVIESQRIPKEVGKITVAQVSDVHLGLMIREERLERIVAAIRAVNPDLLVATGDLVDGQINDLSQLIEPFRAIKPRLGKYAITGNHEFYAGLDQALDYERQAGFSVLRGESVLVGDVLTIVGIDDPAVKYYPQGGGRSEAEMLAAVPQERFVLLLKHRPLVEKESIGKFDLQLSGHVHKGQIFPFSLLTKLYYPVDAGFARLSARSALYVSRGTGTWGPPIRFLAPPEVTVIELIHAEPWRRPE